MLKRLFDHVFARQHPSMALALASGMAPMLGGDALALIVDLIPRNFGLRDLGGGQPIADGEETRQAIITALDQHQPITPYYLVDLLRGLDLVGNEAGGFAVFDAVLAQELTKAAAVQAGRPAQIQLMGFDAASISSDRLRFTAASIATNAAAIADRWSD